MRATVKLQCLVAGLVFLGLMAGCEERSIPVSLNDPVTYESGEDAAAELSTTTSNEPKEASVQLLSVQNWPGTTGKAIFGYVADMTDVTVTSTADGSVAFSSEDEVVAQSFYDAIQIKNEEYDELDIRPCDYELQFTNKMGQSHIYGFWINFQKENAVIIKDGEALWDLPIFESNWFRAMLGGLQ